MQTLRQNRQTVYYAAYVGVTDRVVSGKKTGEKDKTYDYPVELSANLSPAKGAITIGAYGISSDYDRTMVSPLPAVLSEEDILWIGRDYKTVSSRISATVTGTTANGKTFLYTGSAWKLNGLTVSLSDYGITLTGTAKRHDSITVSSATAACYELTKHNYRVTRVSESLNSVTYGLKEVSAG